VSTRTTLTDHEPTIKALEKPLTFWEALRPLRALFYLVAFSSTFTILNCLFVYFVLLREIVETPGHVMWDATKTNVRPLFETYKTLTDMIGNP
jgi:hypothetical protein